MQNEERDPEYGAPPPADPRAGPAPRFNLSPALALRFAAGSLLAALALSLLWQAGLLPGTAAKDRGPLPAGEAPPGSQTPAAGLPERASPGSAGEVQADSLTPLSGGLREEDITPPLPGLLVPRPPTLGTISYTGHPLSPEALAKETSEDRAGCEAGDIFKCLRLGARYLAGHGVERDDKRAFSLINRACAGGVAEACTTQGIMQLAGHGTAQDGPAAVALFDKACGAGDMYGCTMLGSSCLDGKYIPADIPRGLGLMQKACDAKLGQACSLLGMFYAEGKFAPRDPAAAERLLGEACELKQKNACQLQQQLAQMRADTQKKR